MPSSPEDIDRARSELDAAFRANRDWLVRRLALVCGDAEEARDLVQETFVRAAERWPLPDPSTPERWLATVALRLAIDERRRRHRWGFLELQPRDATWALSVDPDLWRALARLDRRTRAAIVLTTLDGYTQDEVAALFDVPRGTVASWISRGRDRLRRGLEVTP
ncbi:MAG TPA: RNA polymerase sigma factor [Candidatus Limnocylindrales bacterium]|nr:RNA polymerase sigma factor [Candidatus Limnocylindrales bacterium]